VKTKNLKYKPQLSGHQEKTYHALLEQDVIDEARKYLLGFIGSTKRDFQVNWHHMVISIALDKFFKRIFENVVFLMPPRVGKTESVSRRFPASALGRDKERRIIATSYSDSLASSANRDVQRIIDSPEYRQIFPETTLSGENVRSNVQGSWLRNNDIFEVVGHRGVYRSAGIGSGITGLGFDIGIIDDPIKNWKEALSPTVRRTHWEWYTSTFFTRREKGAGICLVMTRWHQDDLAGRILQQAKENGENWTVVSFPMIKESEGTLTGYELFEDEQLKSMDPRKPGEPLWPEKYSLEECQKIKTAVGSRVWAGLYQQQPSPEGGALISRKWIKYYSVIPSEALMFGEWLMSWDMAFKDKDDSDFVVGQVWLKHGANKYLIDQVRDRMAFTETIAAVISLAGKYPHVVTKLVEDKANGTAVINTLKDKIPGLIGVEASESKIVRVTAVAPEYEAGNVWYPDPSIAPWVHDHVEEVVSFPQAANDDQMDAASQALLRFRGEASGDFSEDLVPESNKTFAAQNSRGSKW